MSFKDWINPFNKVVDVASEFITDKDKLNEFRFKIQQQGFETYLAELETKTVPWIDALHKMGRQIQGYLALILVFVLIILGHDINVEEAILMGGPAALYTTMKGKGN